MKRLLLLALTLSASAVRADTLEKVLAAQAALKSDPCLAENQQFNFFELMVEAVPVYVSNRKVEGKPPASVILTMDRCDVLTQDHVEGNPMTPTAERRYTSGDWGVILTTALKSEKTFVTIIAKKNGAWTTAGQMGEFDTPGLFDTLSQAKAVVKLAHYGGDGVERPYAMHLAFRPSWSR
ncbi:MAG: hypothetical protein M0D55_01830 [Elusimicrobiota bacterium]|nr:MAG: hypothetical protein M0D55_01830 [Elusimicrobiota bacterium]